jgi:amino-acid N-acetyltransferase
MLKYSIRKAKQNEIKALSDLIKRHNDVMLFRSPAVLRKLLKNYFVAVSEDDKIVGCCGFKIYPGADAEIISLAVERKYRNLGIGTKLIKRATREAMRRKSVKRVMTFTNPSVISRFRRNNFAEAGVQLFHEKILEDCRKCPRNKFDRKNRYLCNEIAMVYIGKQNMPAGT